jgi:UDP-N-acetylmuramate--alanine ligase
MHIFISGIGGTAMGPLALIARAAGYEVSGSDKQESAYLDYLRSKGVDTITIGQTEEQIAGLHTKRPIDWLVYSSAVPLENPHHPELIFAAGHNIRATKRDELLSEIITNSGKKLIAVAGTHGKTTTTAMLIWLFKQLDVPISYSVGAKIPFGEMGQFNEPSEYFVYECDEFDRNFLAFHPHMSLITGIDYDHHEIYPTREDYQDAFRQFLGQSRSIIAWQSDVDSCGLDAGQNYSILQDDGPMLNTLSMPGEVNRRNAWQAVQAIHELTKEPIEKLSKIIESFPGLSRRFEKITNGLYTDYAHTIPKIKGCLQMARELSDQVVVVYEPLTDRRQHYIKDDYKTLFEGVKKLYWVPSYLAREHPGQAILSPEKLIENMENKEIAEPAELNSKLKQSIDSHLRSGDLVVCLSGGGGNSLDEWLRASFGRSSKK